MVQRVCPAHRYVSASNPKNGSGRKLRNGWPDSTEMGGRIVPKRATKVVGSSLQGVEHKILA